VIRLANWPDCLKDEDIAATVKDAIYEGYEQDSGQRTGIYRAR
jgi:hypothetical protein